MLTTLSIVHTEEERAPKRRSYRPGRSESEDTPDDRGSTKAIAPRAHTAIRPPEHTGRPNRAKKGKDKDIIAIDDEDANVRAPLRPPERAGRSSWATKGKERDLAEVDDDEDGRVH